MQRIAKILIANRGEIAVPDRRTCRELGIATVAVYLGCRRRRALRPMRRRGVDSRALAADTYLRQDLILEAAALTGADADPPRLRVPRRERRVRRGCAAAGVTFIGPAPRRSRRWVQDRGEADHDGGRRPDPRRASTSTGRDDAAADAPRHRLPDPGQGLGGRRRQGNADRREPAEPGRRGRRRRGGAGAFGDDTVFLERYL